MQLFARTHMKYLKYAVGATILTISPFVFATSAYAATTLNVTADPTFTAQNIAAGGTQVPLGRFIFTPGSEPVTFSQWVINIASTGGGSGFLENITVYNTAGSAVTNPANILNGGADAIFSDTVFFPADKSTTLTVRADLGLGWKTGEVIQLSFKPASAISNVRGTQTGSSVTPSPAVLVSGPIMTAQSAYVGGDVQVWIEKINDSSALEERVIANVHIIGGEAGKIFNPFAGGLNYVVDMPGVPEEIAIDELKLWKVFYGEIGLPSAQTTVTPVGGSQYLVIKQVGVNYTPRADAEHLVFSIRYKPTSLIEGDTLNLRLLNGESPFIGQYSLAAESAGAIIPQNRIEYGNTITGTINVEVNPEYAAQYNLVKNDIATRFGIDVPDNNRSSIGGLRLIRNVLDSFGTQLFPKNMTAIRIRGYTDDGGGGPWIFPIGVVDSQLFTEVLVHELHHQVDANANDCIKLIVDRCKYLTNDGELDNSGKLLAGVIERSKLVIERAGTIGENYLRTDITLLSLYTTGTITASPTDRYKWEASLVGDVGRLVYKVLPTIRFTTGELSEQEFLALNYTDGKLYVENPNKLFPAKGDKFTLSGEGGLFFQKRPQEFIAGISNLWGTDTRATWATCVKEYKAGRTLVMDQCLLFADMYALGRNEIPLFTQQGNGFIAVTMVPVVKDGDRVIGIPSLGSERFAFDSEGLVVKQLGDTNFDGKILSSDALKLLRIAVGVEASTNLLFEDVNCSGTVTSTDALIVLRASVGQIPTPITCVAAQSVTQPANLSFTKTGQGLITPSLSGTASSPVVTLTATPAQGYVFTAWQGACNSTSPTCIVNLPDGANLSLTAQFSNAQTTVGGDGSTGTFGDGNTDTGSGTNGDTTEPPPPPIVSSNVDLTIAEKNELRTTPNKLYANKALNVIARFTNQGSEASTLVSRISLRIDQGNDGIWDFGTAESLPTMKPKQTKAIKFKKTYEPPQAGTYRYQVCINDDAMAIGYDIPLPIPAFTPGQDESDFSNNCSENTFTVLPPKTRKGGAAAGSLIVLGGALTLFAFSKSRSRVLTLM